MKSFTLLGFCLLHILGLRHVLGNNVGPGAVSSLKGWSAANQTCKSGLIVLDTEQKIMDMLTNERLIQEKEKYWVGLRITDNNDLEWINGIEGADSIRKWNARKCFYFKRKWNCKTGNLHYSKCFKLDNCSSPYKFICGNSSHTVVNSYKKEWSAANQTCKSGLIVLDTEQKIMDMLTNERLIQEKEKYWVGLRITDNNDLEWINGAKGKANIRKWNARNCFYFKSKRKCNIKNLQYSKCFKSDNCSSPYKFICGNSSHTGQASTINTDKATTTSLSSPIEIKSTAASTVSSTIELYSSSSSTLNHEIPPASSMRTTAIKLYPSSSTLNDETPPTTSMRTTSIQFATAPSASLNKKSSSVVKPMINSTTSLRWLSSTVEVDQVTTENGLQRSSLQTPAHHLSSSSASFYMTKSMSSIINPIKASSLYPSTTVNPDPSQIPSSNGDMVKTFRTFIRNLNASDPDCMTVLLNNYENLTERIGEQEDNMEYNPLTDAQSIENVALEFAKFHLSLNTTSVNISNKDIAFYAQLVASDIDSDVVFPGGGVDSHTNTISLPKSLFRGQEKTYVVSVVFKNNKTIRELTPTMMEGHTDEKNWLINTEIFSTTIFPKKNEPFEKKVLIKLQHVQKTGDAKPHCSFWNFSIPSSYNGSWSEQGCHLVSFTKEHTVCACDHLTSFAVLMQLRGDQPSEEHQRALSIITYIGLALSLLGEAITVLLYSIFLKLRNEKIQIRVNLLCALVAAQIVFLAGIDKTANKDVCMSVAAIIHLSYLVCFCWMLMEGVYLYRMVVKVFDAHITMRYCYLFAFGFPSCIVAVSLIIASFQTGGIYSYISSNFCWIRFDNGLIWCFVGPVLFLIAVSSTTANPSYVTVVLPAIMMSGDPLATINSFFLFSALKEMATMKSVKTINSFQLSSIKASARACVLLLPLLGITWLFGLLSLVIDGIEWQYLFTILNATQGFMIFIFHCLRNTELRAAMELRYFQWESNHSNHNSHGRVTPSRDGKILAVKESSKESRSNSIPMATKVNKVSPE